MKETPRLKEQYKERLKKIISTKIQTTMIFPLSIIEASFGQLWGHGKDESKLTDEEKIYRKKWNECRNNILNNGNTQKRNAMAELSQYDVIWNKYQTVLLPMEAFEAKLEEQKRL